MVQEIMCILWYIYAYERIVFCKFMLFLCRLLISVNIHRNFTLMMSAYSLFIRSLWPRDLNYFTLILSVILTASLCGSCFLDEGCENMLQFTQQVSPWDGKLDPGFVVPGLAYLVTEVCSLSPSLPSPFSSSFSPSGRGNVIKPIA